MESAETINGLVIPEESHRKPRDVRVLLGWFQRWRGINVVICEWRR